jgi:hypothetical protein
MMRVNECVKISLKLMTFVKDDTVKIIMNISNNMYVGQHIIFSFVFFSVARKKV